MRSTPRISAALFHRLGPMAGLQRDLRTTSLIVAAFFLFVTETPASEKLYRWVDEKGNIHFSDSIPPAQVNRQYSQFNAKGVEILSVEAAKSAEEIARDKEIQRLRKEQQRLIDEQNAVDQVLLRTFRSEDDVVLARDGKIAAVDVQMQVSSSNNRRLKAKLSDLQKKAAEFERQGNKIPANLEKDIQETRRSLNEGYTAILRAEEQKGEVRAKYDTDLQRFRFLKKLRTTPPARDEVKRVSASDLPRVFPCDDNPTCSRGWENAVAFVKELSTTPIQMVTEQLILTLPPTTDGDTSLTVSRIANKDGVGALLFLDLQCKETKLGAEHCRSEQVREIENRFRGFIEKNEPPRKTEAAKPGSQSR